MSEPTTAADRRETQAGSGLTEEELAEIARLRQSAKLPADTGHDIKCDCPACDQHLRDVGAANGALCELRDLDAVGRLLMEAARLRADVAALLDRDAQMVTACNEVAEAIGDVKRQMEFDEDATLHDVLDSFRSTASELHLCIKELDRLRAEQAADRAAVKALVEALPRCETLAGSCSELATLVLAGEASVLCEQHRLGWARDLPHAAPLRALQARVATWGEGEGQSEPAVVQAAAPDDLAAHELDVARIRKALETGTVLSDPEDIADTIDWPAFLARRARLGKAAEAIEAPVRATVEWMEHEGSEPAWTGLDLTPRNARNPDPSSPPLPPEPDDEPSAYDADVAARMATRTGGKSDE